MSDCNRRLSNLSPVLASAISSLQSAISETNAYMQRLIAAVQQTDLRYAQKMSIINEQIAGYTAKMQELFDSFNDDFRLQVKIWIYSMEILILIHQQGGLGLIPC